MSLVYGGHVWTERRGVSRLLEFQNQGFRSLLPGILVPPIPRSESPCNFSSVCSPDSGQLAPHRCRTGPGFYFRPRRGFLHFSVVARLSMCMMHDLEWFLVDLAAGKRAFLMEREMVGAAVSRLHGSRTQCMMMNSVCFYQALLREASTSCVRGAVQDDLRVRGFCGGHAGGSPLPFDFVQGFKARRKISLLSLFLCVSVAGFTINCVPERGWTNTQCEASCTNVCCAEPCLPQRETRLRLRTCSAPGKHFPEELCDHQPHTHIHLLHFSPTFSSIFFLASLRSICYLAKSA